MRTALLLLLLANVVLFGYARLDRAAQSEAGRLGAQVQPDRIRVLSSQQVAALGPGKVAALPDVCVEWGPFAEADRLRALADIEPLQLGRLLTQRSAGADPVWWVNTGPVTTRGAADKRAAELRANGSAYRSHAWRAEHQQLGIRHSRTRPRRPQTNGKVERLNRTLLEEWAYRRLSHQRENPSSGSVRLAAPLQPPPAPHRAGQPPTHQSVHQRLRAVHLAG